LRTVDVVHGVIRKMVETGEISEKRIDESFRRVMTLKKLLRKGDKQTMLWQTLNETQAKLTRTEQALKEAQDLANMPRRKRKNKKKK
jgi:beta-N-acetylhexosaminidase